MSATYILNYGIMFMYTNKLINPAGAALSDPLPYGCNNVLISKANLTQII